MLYLFFTNNASLVDHTEVIPGISDHEMVVVDQTIKPVYNKPKPRTTFLYQKTDWEKLRNRLSDLSSKIVSSVVERTVNENWETFRDGILEEIRKCIPSKKISNRINTPWFNNKMKRLIRKKHKLFKKARSSGKADAWAAYKKHKSACQKALRNQRWDYINTIIDTALEQNDVKPLWKYIKSKKQDNIGVSSIKHKGQLFAGSKTKAELLNNQFTSVFTRDTTEVLPEIQGNSFPQIPPLQITVGGVTKLLKSLKTNKASGPDGLPNRILKECAEELSPALTAIFNQSLNTGELPEDWRNANVSPIYKKESRHEAENYRPVSLTCVCCKVMEHIICKHMLNHLEKNNILIHLQHGFRSGHSCESQLILTLHDLTRNLSLKKQTDVAILDFSKAFDTVPHKRLLHKLKHYGIHGAVSG